MHANDRKLWVGVLLVFSLGYGGCAMFSSVETPSWVMGKNDQYPSNQYLVGVGRGASTSAAEERAYAAVAKIFTAHVQSRVQDAEAFRMVEKEGSTQTTRELSLDQSTRVTTNKVLENVQIFERWIHPDTREVYVLAGLDRHQVEQGLVEKIRDYDRTMHDDVELARNRSDKLIHIGKLRHAIQIWHEREAVNADLRVIRESGRGIPARYRLNELTQELDAFLQDQFLVEVSIEGEQGRDVQAAIMQHLRREGLPVQSGGGSSAFEDEAEGSLGPQEPDVRIQGKVRVWNIESPDPLFVYARWCGGLQIIDPNQNRVVGIVNRSGREGHVTTREARARASRVMQSTLAEEVVNTFFASFQADASESHPIPSSSCFSNMP